MFSLAPGGTSAGEVFSVIENLIGALLWRDSRLEQSARQRHTRAAPLGLVGRGDFRARPSIFGAAGCTLGVASNSRSAESQCSSARASSAHGRERNACGMRWRQSRARLSREKLLHLVESFLKSTHVIL